MFISCTFEKWFISLTHKPGFTVVAHQLAMLASHMGTGSCSACYTFIKLPNDVWVLDISVGDPDKARGPWLCPCPELDILAIWGMN